MRWMWTMVVLGMFLGAAPADSKVLSTPNELIRGELKFPKSDGWGKPVITRSADGYALQLWFSQAPIDGLSSVAVNLTNQARHALTQVEVYRVPGQTVVQVHLRSKAKGLFVKRAHNPRGWKLVAHLHEPPEIPGVSYADRKLIPSFVVRTLLGSVMSDLKKGERANCSMLDEMSSASHGWPAWVALAQADCFRYIGNKERSAAITQRLVRQRGIPKAAMVLAGLRLEEWPETYNPWIRMGMSNKEILKLPRSVIQELNIRQARKMMRDGKLKRAVSTFVLALNKAILPESLEWSVQDVRFEMMERALAEDKPHWAVKLFQAHVMPPNDHPAFLPTLRAGAIAYARTGFMDQAATLSEIVLHPKGSVVDPELTTAVVRSLRGSTKHYRLSKLSRAIPTELNWIGMLGEKDMMSPSTSLLLAEWLLDVWDEAGVREANRMANSAYLVDPSQAYSESRMAVMLGAKDCDALMDLAPGALPNDRAGFASLCYLQDGSPLEPLEPFNIKRSDPLAENGLLGHVAREYAEGSSDFYSELSQVSDELSRRDKKEQDALEAKARLNLQLSSDKTYEVGGGDGSEMEAIMRSAEDYDRASSKILKAAEKLKASGKLDQDEALREAVKRHAEASAKLLESIATKQDIEN